MEPAMSIPSTTSSIIANPGSVKGLMHQRREDFQSLTSAVQTGDLTAAQAALAAMQTDTQNLQNARGLPNSLTSGQPSKLQSDFANLVSSIQAANASGAQNALATLKTDSQALIGGGTGVSGSSQSGFKQDLAALIQAIQAGDMSGAQGDLTKLQSDAKALGGGHHHRHGGGAVDQLLAAIDGNTAGNAGANSANISAISAYASMSTQPASASSLSAQA
jgi:hypothetical protein